MKASDLRIGNLVKRYLGANEYKPIVLKSISDTGEFTYIDQDEKTLYLVRNNFKGLEPIDLTKEWLLKMGFQFPESEFEGEIIVNKESRFSAIRAKGFYSVGLAGSFGLFLTKLKYVHEVQNLYHSVFGEELTIK